MAILTNLLADYLYLFHQLSGARMD